MDKMQWLSLVIGFHVPDKVVCWVRVGKLIVCVWWTDTKTNRTLTLCHVKLHKVIIPPTRTSTIIPSFTFRQPGIRNVECYKGFLTVSQAQVIRESKASTLNRSCMWNIKIRFMVNSYIWSIEIRIMVNSYIWSIEIRFMVNSYIWSIEIRFMAYSYIWSIEIRFMAYSYIWSIEIRFMAYSYILSIEIRLMVYSYIWSIEIRFMAYSYIYRTLK